MATPSKSNKTTTPTLKSVFGDSAIKTTVMYGGKEHLVFKNGSNYYIVQYSNGIPIKQDIIGKDNTFKENPSMCIDINKSNLGVKSNTGTSSSSSNTGTKTETSTSKPVTQTTGGGGGYAAPYAPSPDMSRYAAEIEALQRELAELKRPRSAKEIAEIYGLTDQYNEENILKDYNEATNQYYDTAVAEQNKLRTNYARNNATYVDRVADAYLDSYKNSAPTAVGRGTRAANTLSTLLQAEQTNASNDYGMMQSVNNLEEARKAELAANPDLARQYYNNMGTYLSTLSATLNQSDVKQYVDSLDAYSSKYAADRSYQSYLAQANAAKYAGLANAALTNAQAASNSYNSTVSAFERLWNYYNKVGGYDSDYASNYVAGLLKASQNKID